MMDARQIVEAIRLRFSQPSMRLYFRGSNIICRIRRVADWVPEWMYKYRPPPSWAFASDVSRLCCIHRTSWHTYAKIIKNNVVY